MFPSALYQRASLESTAHRLGCQPLILEKSLIALTLLGHLRESGLPFLFKGGTSLMLHFERISRLSIDIDIMCGATEAEVDAAAESVAGQAPFLRMTPDPRGYRGLPHRRHFKFFYRSALPGMTDESSYVLLDVVEESEIRHRREEKVIRTPFLLPAREILVTLPTIESLLGDKLTAFAPTTIGVPLRKEDGSERDALQVAKQLFDVGVLFEVARDFVAVRETYGHLQAQESGYRGQGHTREDCLDDTIRACMGLTARQMGAPVRRRFDTHPIPPPDYDLLWRGFEAMRSHAGNVTYEQARTYAARTALLATALRWNHPVDFVTLRTELDALQKAQFAPLREVTLNRTPYAWLEPLKGINPEAYFYWEKISRIVRAA